MTTRRTMSLLALTLALALPVRAAEAPDYKIPNKDWGRGPVRWLLSDDEEKEWKKLRADDERAKFAKEFWAKRDPTPGTEANEYEMVFWKRVEQADKNFKSISKPGSLTDMGRVFLLLGPPTKTDKDAKGMGIWTYEPNELTQVDTKIVMRFAAADTGGGALLLDHKLLDQYVDAHPAARGIGWKIPIAAQAKSETPEAAPAKQTSEDQSPESQRQIAVLQAALAAGSGPSDVPMRVAYDFFAAVDGTTLTAVNIEVPRDAAHGSGDQALLPFARIAPASGEGKPVNLTGAQSFVAAPLQADPGSSFVYQVRRNLAPGAYTIAVVLEDKVVKGKSGTLVQRLDVPDFRPKEFGLNGITLLATFERLDGGLGPGETEHGAGVFVVGSFRLVPRAMPILQKGDAFSFYYQVYNPVPDAGGGRFNLEATYTFLLKEGGAWKPFRKPIVKTLAGQVELYSIDLKDFLVPNQTLPAEFRMEVKVADKIGGKETKREVEFSVR
jgi:GWxTD domain-containing protein